MDDAGEKTEQPTARKREEARERGQVARSVDLSTAVILLTSLLVFRFSGHMIWDGLSKITVSILQNMHHPEINVDTVVSAFLSGMLTLLWIMLPFVVAVSVAAFLINVIQVGFVVSGQPLVPDITKMDPIKGLKRIYSLRSVVKTFVSILKIVFISTVVYLTLKGEISTINSMVDQSINEIFLYSVNLSFEVGIRMSLALLLLALLDFSYQRYQTTRDLMMTKQEVKEEMKRMEGDPKIKERRRQIQRQLAMQRMMAGVPKADVIVTNPTHFAVALQYEEEFGAPKVVGKGADLIALRIREIAEEHQIPIFEDPPLARELFKKCEIDQIIPVELWAAVAEVLAYIYKTNKKQVKSPVEK